MEIFDIALSSQSTARNNDIEREVEESLRNYGLDISMKGTLAKHPGSIHWHWIKKGSKGTCELTWLPSQQKLWFQVHSGRRADWITELLPELISAFEQRYGENEKSITSEGKR